MSEPRPMSSQWKNWLWGLYEHLPAAADDVLKWRFRYLLPFKNLRVPVLILRGSIRTDNRAITVVFAGDEGRLNYLVQGTFEGVCQREMIGKVPLWNLPRTLADLRTSADLTIAFIHQLAAGLFFDEGYLVVPELVGTMLSTPQDLASLTRQNASLISDLKTVKRNNLSAEISHDEKDFEKFYQSMYVLSVRNRHGAHAVIRDVHGMRRAWRRGGVLLIRQNRQVIAGELFQRLNNQLHKIAFGTLDGEFAHVQAGANAAADLFTVRYAKKLGCKSIDFGGCHPSLNNGGLRYKRKWGVRLAEYPDIWHTFLVYWNHFNGPVASFLCSTPLIFRDQGGFSGIKAIECDKPATDVEARKAYRANWIPDLKRLYLVAPHGWEIGENHPPHISLINSTYGGCRTSTVNPGSEA